jgi:hypothetical protein
VRQIRAGADANLLSLLTAARRLCVVSLREGCLNGETLLSRMDLPLEWPARRNALGIK